MSTTSSNPSSSAITAELKKLRRDVPVLKAKVSYLQQEVKSFQEELEEAREELKEAKSELETARAPLGSQPAAGGGSLASQEEVEQVQSLLDNKCTELQQVRANLAEVCQAYRRQSVKLKTAVEKNNLYMERLQTMYDSVTGKDSVSTTKPLAEVESASNLKVQHSNASAENKAEVNRSPSNATPKEMEQSSSQLAKSAEHAEIKSAVLEIRPRKSSEDEAIAVQDDQTLSSNVAAKGSVNLAGPASTIGRPQARVVAVPEPRPSPFPMETAVTTVSDPANEEMLRFHRALLESSKENRNLLLGTSKTEKQDVEDLDVLIQKLEEKISKLEGPKPQLDFGSTKWQLDAEPVEEAMDWASQTGSIKLRQATSAMSMDGNRPEACVAGSTKSGKQAGKSNLPTKVTQEGMSGLNTSRHAPSVVVSDPTPEEAHVTKVEADAKAAAKNVAKEPRPKTGAAFRHEVSQKARREPYPPASTDVRVQDWQVKAKLKMKAQDEKIAEEHNAERGDMPSVLPPFVEVFRPTKVGSDNQRQSHKPNVQEGALVKNSVVGHHAAFDDSDVNQDDLDDSGPEDTAEEREQKAKEKVADDALVRAKAALNVKVFDGPVPGAKQQSKAGSSNRPKRRKRETPKGVKPSKGANQRHSLNAPSTVVAAALPTAPGEAEETARTGYYSVLSEKEA